MLSNELKEIAWSSAQVVVGYDPDLIRQDACGAWIAYADFNNRESLYGWEIEHIYPSFRLKRLNVPEKMWNNPMNIRAPVFRIKITPKSLAIDFQRYSY